MPYNSEHYLLGAKFALAHSLWRSHGAELVPVPTNLFRVDAVGMEVAVSLADESPEDEEKLIVDQEWLARAVESILKGDPDAPETMARVFISFRHAIKSGLRGMNQLDEALLAAIEIIYLQSRAHVAALKLYVLAQEGHVRIEDEPLNVLGAAITRSRASVEGAAVKGRGRARRRV